MKIQSFSIHHSVSQNSCEGYMETKYTKFTPLIPSRPSEAV